MSPRPPLPRFGSWRPCPPDGPAPAGPATTRPCRATGFLRPGGNASVPPNGPETGPCARKRRVPGGMLGPVVAPPGQARGRTCRTRARTPPAVASCSLIFDKGKTHVCETGLRVCVPICPTGSPCRQSGISRPRRLRTRTCFLALSDGPSLACCCNERPQIQ